MWSFLSFPKEGIFNLLKPDVLRGKKEFSSIYNKGKSVGDRFVVLFYKKNQLAYNRTAFLSSKKVGNSVKRNRARRLMKESYRSFSNELPIGYDFIMIARNTINEASFFDVKKSIKSAYKRVKW